MMPITSTKNYKKSDNINYLDGDIESQMGIDWNTFLDETSDKDTSKVKIDKWNQSVTNMKTTQEPETVLKCMTTEILQ